MLVKIKQQLQYYFISALVILLSFFLGSLLINPDTVVSPIDAVMIVFIIHWVMFIPSYVFQTEKFYDLTGSITYVCSMTYLLVNQFQAVEPSMQAYKGGWSLELSSPIALIAYLCVMIWTLRLGIFLFRRVLKDGEDKRFRKILPSFSNLFMAWNLSATWVVIQTLPLAVVLSGNLQADLGPWAFPATIFGLGLWIYGFVTEVVADNQKTEFKKDPKNKDKFISAGLWSKSRHPNYFGEIVLWLGLTIICLPFMSGFQYVAIISPIFAYLLIYYVSGVSMLEAKANKKWGKDRKYIKYKEETPIFFPKF